MGMEMIKSVVGNKGISGYKNMGKFLEDVEGSILKVMNRAAKSKYCLGTTQTSFGYEQIFKKNGTIIRKQYIIPREVESGSITTSTFMGDKAKIIENDSYYAGITQPDKLVNQSWYNYTRLDPDCKFHTFSVTTPTEQATPFTIERGIHLKQQTKALRIGDRVAYKEYPSRIDYDPTPFPRAARE